MMGGFFSAVKGMWTIALSVGGRRKGDYESTAKRVDFQGNKIKKISPYIPENSERVHESKYRLVE